MKIRAGGVEIAYEVYGEGEPVLLVHGFPLSSALWDDVVDRLKGKWKLIVPDLRGHGASEAGEARDMGRYASDLAAVLRATEETRPVVLVGMSMGGYVALEFYRRYRGRVRALALVDSRAARDTPEAASGRLETADKVIRDGSGVVANAMVEKLFAAGASRELRERWRSVMTATPRQGVATALRAMAARPDSRRLLKQATIPILIVVGAEDAITPPSEARSMAAGTGAGRIVVIPGAGHMTPVEQPEELARVLDEFLSGLKRLNGGTR